MGKAPHGLGCVVAWGVMPLSLGKCGAGAPLYLSSEEPIIMALGTCVAGLPGSRCHPGERCRGSWWPWSFEVPRGQAPF